MEISKSVAAIFVVLSCSAAVVLSNSWGNEYSNEINIENVNKLSRHTQATKTKGLFRRLVSPDESLEVAEHEVKDAGKPLFLTPLIQQGKISEARNLSRVILPDDPMSTHSFSGYLTVDPKYDSNMFFWFFPAKERPHTAPVLIWLQGGPGGSSLFGLFAENGPFNVDKDMKLVYRNYSWSDKHNLLYFDNPVGTGFSFTGADAGYVQDESAVGAMLYLATQQFLQLFPELRANPLYVSGESYAGKYVPALSYTIHKNNPTAEQKINFKGMAIGDGLCDPVSMTDYGHFLYDIGLLDEVQRDQFVEKQNTIVEDINHQLWRKAFLGFDELLNGDTTGVPSLFTNTTGLTFYYNYLMEQEPQDMGYYFQYVNQASIRRAIHVGNKTFNDGRAVEDHLITDVMKSVKPWIEEILNNRDYRVMIYNGQLDVIIAYPLTRNFVESLEWADSQLYLNAPRKIWKVGSVVAGYVKETPNFVEVLVRGAGHMVPYDQPSHAYDMINRFTGAAQQKIPTKFLSQEN